MQRPLAFVPRYFSALTALAFGSDLTVAAAQDKLALFAAVRWVGEVPQVQVEGQWYELESIDGLSTAELVSFCRRSYDRKWQKRFEEDLVEVLQAMGAAPGTEIALGVRSLDSGESKMLPNVPMTKENRRALWAARAARERGERGAARPFRMTAQQAQSDVDQLHRLIDERYAYARWRGVDYSRDLNDLKRRLKGDVELASFALELRKSLARFGDGHSRVRGWWSFVPRGYAPFVIEDLAGRLVALTRDRKSLLDKHHPFIVSLDDRPVEDWLRAASTLVADGSPQFVCRGAVEILHCVEHVRRELGLPTGRPLALR